MYTVNPHARIKVKGGAWDKRGFQARGIVGVVWRWQRQKQWQVGRHCELAQMHAGCLCALSQTRYRPLSLHSG